MFAESRSAARGAQQFLPLLRRPNTYTCQRKTGTFSSDNLQKSRRFSSKSPWYFCGSGVYSRSLVPLHLQMVFMSFSAIPQGFRDDGFSELDANEMKVDEGFKDAISKKVPSLTSIFSNPNVTRSVKSVISIPCGKNEKKSVKSVTSIPSEKKENKNVISVTSIPSEKNEKKSVNSVTSIPSEKRKKKSVNSVTPISSGKTEKKNVKSEQQQKTTPKTEKAKGGLDILQHPWPEWVQFLEHLNERGYLNKAFHYQWPIELRDLSTEGIYVFIKFAAFSFAEDHVEISKGRVLGCPHLSVKRNRLGSQKAKDLVYVHSNLRLVSHRGEEYTSGPHKEWDVDVEFPYLELSLSTFDICASGDASATRSTCRVVSSADQAFCSIFVDEDEELY